MGVFTGKSASYAADYFEKDGGYYVMDRLKDGTVLGSEWIGKMSKEHFGQRVSPPDFRRALDGHSLDGQSIKNRRADRRLYWDVCNSAPKSVSMAALFDERIAEAVKVANRDSMAVLEKQVQGRVFKNKRTVVENTSNFLIAVFEHWNARASKDSAGDSTTSADVSLHRHNAILNMTERSDGTIGAIHNRQMFEAASKVAREAFYASLTRELKSLGYRLRIETNKVGQKFPEIASVSREQVLAFSRRHRSIKELKQQLLAKANDAVDEKRLAVSIDKAAYYMQRDGKEHIDLDKLKEAWRQQILALGVTFEMEPKVDKQLNSASRQLAAEARLGDGISAAADAIRDRIASSERGQGAAIDDVSLFATGAPATQRMINACEKVAKSRGEPVPENATDFGVAREYLARYGGNPLRGPVLSAGEDRIESADAVVTESHMIEAAQSAPDRDIERDDPAGREWSEAGSAWSFEAGWWDDVPKEDSTRQDDRSSHAGSSHERAEQQNDERSQSRQDDRDMSQQKSNRPGEGGDRPGRTRSSGRDSDLAVPTAHVRESMAAIGAYDFVHFREVRDARELLQADMSSLEQRGRGEGNQSKAGADGKPEKLTLADRMEMLSRAAEMRRFEREHSGRLVSIQGRVYGQEAPQGIGGAFTVSKLRPADGRASPGYLVSRDGIAIGLARKVDIGRAIRTRGDLSPVSDVKLKKNQISFTDETGARKTYEIGERAGWRGNKAMVVRDRETGRYVGSLVLDLKNGRAQFTSARLVKDPAETRREKALKLSKNYDRAYFHRGMSMYKREKFLFFKWTRKVGAGERAAVYTIKATGLALKGSALLVRYAAKALVNTLAVRAANKWQLGDERGAFRLRSDELRKNILAGRGYSKGDIELSLKQDDLAKKAMDPAKYKIYLETKYSRDPDERLQTAIAGLKSETFFSRAADEVRERVFSVDSKSAWDAGRATWEREGVKRADPQPTKLEAEAPASEHGRDAGQSTGQKSRPHQDNPQRDSAGNRPSDPKRPADQPQSEKGSGASGRDQPLTSEKSQPGQDNPQRDSAGDQLRDPKPQSEQPSSDKAPVDDRRWEQVREGFGLDQATIDKMRSDVQEIEAAAPKQPRVDAQPAAEPQPGAPTMKQPTDQEREQRGEQPKAETQPERAQAKPGQPVEHERGGEQLKPQTEPGQKPAAEQQPGTQPAKQPTDQERGGEVKVEPQREQAKSAQPAEPQPGTQLVKPPAEQERGGEQPKAQTQPERAQAKPGQPVEHERGGEQLKPQTEPGQKPAAEQQPGTQPAKQPTDQERGGGGKVEPEREQSKPARPAEQSRGEGKPAVEQQPGTPLVKPPADHERGGEQPKAQAQPERDQAKRGQPVEQPRNDAKPATEQQRGTPLVKPPAEHERGGDQLKPQTEPGQKPAVEQQPDTQPAKQLTDHERGGEVKVEPQREQSKPAQPAEQSRGEGKPAVEQQPGAPLLKPPADHERGSEQPKAQPQPERDQVKPGQKPTEHQLGTPLVKPPAEHDRGSDQVKPQAQGDQKSQAQPKRSDQADRGSPKTQRTQLFKAIAERAAQVKRSVEQRTGKTVSVAAIAKRIKTASQQRPKEAPQQPPKKVPPRDRGMDR